MKIVSLLIFLAFAAIFPINGQSSEERTAREVSRFETDWLTAGLNNDDEWLRRFFSGRLSFQPTGGEAKDRQHAIAGLFDPTLSPNEMKVRITGTVSLLTNDPARNRSFNFLDTFNKRDGKWEVIAEHFSAGVGIGQAAAGSGQIERQLLELENAWAQVDVTNDRSIFDRIIAPDFVSTNSDGEVRNRREWLANWDYEVVIRATNTDMRVQVYSDSLAVVTGVDRTVKLDKDKKEIVHEDRFTDTWLNRNGQWQVIAAHVTRIE